jgi:hypothetical protein
MCIFIRLDCIWWFKWCHGWMCVYTYILQSSEIFVCLYDQVMMSMIFRIWLSDVKFRCACIPIFSEVVEYLYTCITRFWMSLIFMFHLNDVMFGCACILVLFEVMKYLSACITRLWGHWFLYLEMLVFLCFSKSWNACIRV